MKGVQPVPREGDAELGRTIYYLILAYCKKSVAFIYRKYERNSNFLPFLGKNYLENLANFLIKYEQN